MSCYHCKLLVFGCATYYKKGATKSRGNFSACGVLARKLGLFLPCVFVPGSKLKLRKTCSSNFFPNFSLSLRARCFLVKEEHVSLVPRMNTICKKLGTL